ncbi:MAG: DUF2062 domain-containing protein [Burkholderiales bacterium]|jgi:uncharacterized protein (DUF2062 family)|nr:DUF2062 domain-containing protein [Burkholderiales bacterium]
MPRKYFRKYLPTHKSILDNRWIAWCGPWLKHHNLWHLHRRSVAGGVAVGLFAGLVPGPLQILTGVGLSILFRVNLPVAALVTFYTNPLTIVPLYYLAYRYGALVTMHDAADQLPATFSTSGHTLTSWIPALIDWMVALGKPLAVGLPLLAITLAAIGYLLVDNAWKIYVRLTWRRRQQRNQESQ